MVLSILYIVLRRLLGLVPGPRSGETSKDIEIACKEAPLPLGTVQSPADRGLHVLPGEQAARPDPYPASLEDGSPAYLPLGPAGLDEPQAGTRGEAHEQRTT